MRKLLFVCLVTLLQLNNYAQSEITYFVSIFGSDENPGTKAAPFKSVQKAAEVVSATSQRTNKDIYVNLRGGVYRLEEPISINPRHSGKEGSKVIFQGYGAEQPVLSGGVSITGWEPHADGIWKAPAKGLYFRQVYVNDRRAIRSRQPNAGDYYRLKGWDQSGRRMIVSGSQVSRWRQFQHVEMVLQQRWAESYLRLKSFSLHGTVGGKDAFVTIQDNEREILFPRPYPRKENDQVFHFENAYEFLDMPGEWYLDEEADMLFYKPRADEEMEFIRVTVPRTETLVRVKGTMDQPVRNIVFKGITFAHSTWTYPGWHGYLNMQSGQYNTRADSINNQYVGRPPAAVRVANAKNIQLIGNTFRHLGSTAIDFEQGTHNCEASGNVIHDISGNGITVGKFTQDSETESHVPYDPDDKREICTNDIISNNVIFRTGRDYYGTSAIAAGYPSGLTIAHNLIRDIPYTGISVGFGWTSALNAMKDNIIASNRISGVMTMMADGAGIYTLSMQPGTRITRNYIFGIQPSKWADHAPAVGIYLDEATSGTDKHPFVVSQNFVKASGFRRYNFHAIGDVELKDEYYYLHQEGAREIRDKAGLEPGYRHLESRLADEPSPIVDTRDIVMMTELRDEAAAIEKYEYLHSSEGVWPEVVHAAHASGIQKIRIYRYGNMLVMIITLPHDLDVDRMNEVYGTSSNRITEWDALMKDFMQTPPGADEGATWVPMEVIHYYENGVVK